MRFLSKRFVVAYHARLIDLFGGAHGLRDEGLLDSAVAQPEPTFDGEPLHSDVWEIAAAYGWHICRNHPFIDGNKRVAAVAMGTLLAINGEESVFDEVALYLTVVAITEGRMDKAELAAGLRTHGGGASS
ncbi:MAG: hypothetical protein AMXMBFR64_36600 [Myxococcales bacterium]